MLRLIDRIHPAFRTGRRDYWLFCAGYGASLIAFTAVAAVSNGAPRPALGATMVILSMLLSVILLCITIRRLHDAGMSPWWVVLFLCPITFDLDLFHISFHTPAMLRLPGTLFSFTFFDFRALIVFVPILLGLFKRSAPLDHQSI